ncbi:MAG: serpin family protein [Mucilaginibacter sp.]
MKRIIPLHCLLLLIILFASCSKTGVKPNPGSGIKLVLNSTEQQQAVADNAFSLNLFKTVQTGDNSGNNLFLSPLSVSIALGMTSNGANGATLDAMKNTLGFTGFSQDDMNSYYNKLITDLPKLDPQTTLNIANSIWYRQGFSVLPQFIQTNTTYFNAKIQELDFNSPSATNTINGWVSDQTKGKIPTIVGQISSSDIMYLINAIYFKSVWKSKFDPAQTHQQAFYLPDMSTVQTDFMKGGSISYNIFNDTRARIVELPYANSKYSMVIVSPTGSNTLSDVTSTIDTATWNHWMSKLIPYEGEVIMPKFKFSYSILLNNSLRAMGMGNAFSGSADFTKISSAGGLSISKVQHKAFVAVDETGTEAAAATSVVIGLTASLPPPPVTIDHPFFFVIREMNTGLIVFAGTVNNPLQQ